MAEIAEHLGVPLEKVAARALELAEFNPMLGKRGCRIGIAYPEIYEMQARAIFEAACDAGERSGAPVRPEIMIPLVSAVRELEVIRASIDAVAEDVRADRGTMVEYMVGVMIETPRACLRAGDIARIADFISFGTNDLTQMLYGLSRDDAGRFMPDYVEKGVFEHDPFHRIDEELFRSFLKEDGTGVHLPAPPPRADDLNGPSMEEVSGLFRLCRRHFTNVVVDCGNTLTGSVDAALLEADEQILVATPELPTLRNLQRALEVIESHGTNGRRPPKIVVNQFAEGVGLATRDIEEGLGVDVAATIERADPEATESINLGRPLVLGKRSRVSKAVESLAREVADPQTIVESEGGFLETVLRPFRGRGGSKDAESKGTTS